MATKRKPVVTNLNRNLKPSNTEGIQGIGEPPSEAQLKEECWQLMRRVAHKRSNYPQHCAKYVSKTLECKIDQLVSAAMKINTPVATEDDDLKITDELIEDSRKKFEKIASLRHFNTIYDSLQEAKAVLNVLYQISKESSCETDLIIKEHEVLDTLKNT